MKSLGPAAPWADDEDEDAVSERAAEIFARRRWGVWSKTDQADFDAWLKQSVLHEVAWLRVEAIAARTDRLAACNAMDAEHAQPGGGVKLRRRWVVIPLLAAASIALFSAFGIPFVRALMQPPERSFSTDIGDHTLLKFADGTEIDLDTDTAVHYRMTTAERTVWLEKGEAWFHVSHNAAHPFAVVVGKHRITDLGTEFLVRRGADGMPDRMEVALLNGRAALNTEGVQTAMLKPGDDAVATPVSVSVTRKTPQELADALAWRQGMLVFRNARLADAVREINRYSTTKLVIADPSIIDLKFNGEIRSDNFEGFLRIAQTMMKLRVDREGNEILISRGQQDETKKAARLKHGL